MELVIGGTGDGKTKNAVRRIFNHLDEGGTAACNFHFKPGWAWRMAVRSWDHKELGKPLETVARSFWNRLWLCGTPETIVQFAKLTPGLVEGPVAKRFDRHGLVVLDEGHFYISPENYRQNGPWLGVFNQQRKRKIHVMLITNDASFLDTKIRKLFKVITRSINLSEHWRIPGTDIGWPRPEVLPWLPRPTYLQRRFSPLTKGSGRSTFFRDQAWLNDLYDTDEIFDFDSLPTALEPQGLLGENPFGSSQGVSLPRHKLKKWPNRVGRDGICTFYNFIEHAV